MNMEQMRARLAAIVASLGALQAKSELSDEEVTQVEEMNTEFEGLTRKIEAREKLDAMTAKAGTSTRQTAPAAIPAQVAVGAERVTLDPKRGFKSAGEFYLAVKAKNEKMLNAAGLMEKFGEDGGFLIPEDFRQDLQKKVMGDESLLPRCTQFQTASNNLTLPTTEVAPWDSAAGFQAYWEAEASQFTASKTKFGQLSMRLNKLTALVKVTDELLEDAPLMESYIRANAPDAMLHKVNSAIIGGLGAGMPEGFLKSNFKKMVPKETGQAADSVVFENINKMLAALVPSSMGRAIWLINPAILPLLRLMTFGTGGANPVPVYLPSTGVSGTPYGTLYGLPILPQMGGVKAVGDEGDISLVDLKYYYAAVKAGAGGGLGVKTDISTHVYFDTNESAFRFIMRMAGQVPFKAPITNEAGDYVCSGIVTLADRP